jgi:tetratricopeptide (TPR) repeat protein
MNTRGLALQLKQWVAGEYELHSLGYLLKQQGLKKEALRIFQFNAILYPESANCLANLAEGLLENGENKTAVQYFEKALELNKDPQKVRPVLELLYKAKSL